MAASAKDSGSSTARPRLSATVIAHNEEDNLPDCLERLRFADEIVVILDRCTDRSRDIAAGFTDRIVEGAWPLESDRRRIAEETASGEWVLEIDADERVPEALAREIEAVVAESPYDYHLIPFDNYIGGRRIRYGWGATIGVGAKNCLFRRGIREIGSAELHSPIRYRGKPGSRLTGRIDHYVDDDISDFIDRLNRYTSARARDLKARGIKESLAQNIRRFFSRFWRCYVGKKGYREGLWGVLIALMAGLYPLLSYIKAELEDH